MLSLVAGLVCFLIALVIAIGRGKMLWMKISPSTDRMAKRLFVAFLAMSVFSFIVALIDGLIKIWETHLFCSILTVVFGTIGITMIVLNRKTTKRFYTIVSSLIVAMISFMVLMVYTV